MNKRLKEDRATHADSIPHYLDECQLHVFLEPAVAPWGTPNKYGYGTYFVSLKSSADSVCPCFYDPKTMGRFKEQPKFQCHHVGCSNMRREGQLPIQELRLESIAEVLLSYDGYDAH